MNQAGRWDITMPTGESLGTDGLVNIRDSRVTRSRNFLAFLPITATLNATGKQKLLLTGLHGIQGAAKQMQRLLEADGDTSTHFDTTPYLIGQRLNPNKATLLQNADTLIALAEAAALPGLDTSELDLIKIHLGDDRDARDGQGGANEIAGTERMERDGLIKRINGLRIALQHAADRAYPYTDDTNDAARTAFHLPLDRTFNG